MYWSWLRPEALRMYLAFLQLVSFGLYMFVGLRLR